MSGPPRCPAPGCRGRLYLEPDIDRFSRWRENTAICLLCSREYPTEDARPTTVTLCAEGKHPMTVDNLTPVPNNPHLSRCAACVADRIKAGALVAKCAYSQCDQQIVSGGRGGEPRRFCSPQCRGAAGREARQMERETDNAGTVHR